MTQQEKEKEFIKTLPGFQTMSPEDRSTALEGFRANNPVVVEEEVVEEDTETRSQLAVKIEETKIDSNGEEVKETGSVDVDPTVEPSENTGSQSEDTSSDSPDKPDAFDENGKFNLDFFSEETRETAAKVNSMFKEERFYGQPLADAANANVVQPYESVAKVDETITSNGYDYKYQINEEGKGVYFTKQEGNDDWIETKPGTASSVAVASEFGHSDFDKESYFSQMKGNKNELAKRAELDEEIKNLPPLTVTVDEETDYVNFNDKLAQLEKNRVLGKAGFEKRKISTEVTKSKYGDTTVTGDKIDNSRVLSEEEFITLGGGTSELYPDYQRRVVVEDELRGNVGSKGEYRRSSERLDKAPTEEEKRKYKEQGRKLVYTKSFGWSVDKETNLSEEEFNKKQKEIASINSKFDKQDEGKFTMNETGVFNWVSDRVTVSQRQEATPEAIALVTKDYIAYNPETGDGVNFDLYVDDPINPNTGRTLLDERLHEVTGQAVNDDPVIQKEMLDIKARAKPLIEAKAKELLKKHDVNTEEGNKAYTEEIQAFAKTQTEDALYESETYKKRTQAIKSVVSGAFAAGDKTASRDADWFFRTMDNMRTVGDGLGLVDDIMEFSADMTEGFTKGSKTIGIGIDKVQVSLNQGFLENANDNLANYEQALEKGLLNEDTIVNVAGGKMPVKEAVKYYTDLKADWRGTIESNLDQITEGNKALTIYKTADFDDGVSFSDVVLTVAEALPQITLATAGTLASVASGGTLAPAIFGALGTVAMGATMYGDAYMDGVTTGIEEDYNLTNPETPWSALTEDQKNTLIADGLETGEYGDKGKAFVTAAVQTSMEKIGAGKILSKTQKALGVGKNGIASLFAGNFKQFGKNLVSGGLAKIESGIIEFGTEAGQEIVGSIGKAATVQSAGGGIGRYTDFQAAWEAGRAGGIVGIAMPFGASIASQVSTEIRTSARQVAINFAPNSNYGKSAEINQQFFNDAQKSLDQKLKKGKDADGKPYTKEQHLEDSINISNIKNASSKIPKGTDKKTAGNILDNLIKKDNLERQIENVGDKDLTEVEQEELDAVKTELKDVMRTEQLYKTSAGVKAAITKANSKIEFKDFENAAEMNKYAENIPGWEKKSSSNHGVVLYNKDTKKERILINNEVSSQEGFKGNVNVGAHEFLHSVLRTTLMNDPKAAKALGGSLTTYLDKLSPGMVDESTVYGQRIKAYAEDGADMQAEEKLTLFSDAIANGDIKFDESFTDTLMNPIRRALQAVGLRDVKFNDGKDVYNFIKDYNRSIEKGKGLNKAQTKVLNEGAKGTLINENIRGTAISEKGKSEQEVEIKESKATQILNRKLAKEAKGGNIESANRLIDDNAGLVLKKLGYNKDIGTVEASKILQVVKDQSIGKGMFKGRQAPLLKKYDGSTEVSTYLGSVVAKRKAEIYKAAGLDPKKFVTTSTDSDQAKQIADTTEQKDFDEKVTKQDLGREKKYPSQMESISKTIKPETIVKVKEDAKRDILLNAKKGTKAIVKSIKSEAKNTARKLAKDTGTFKKGWPNFVKDIVNEGLTKVIPGAALKRRFGKILDIKKTGTTTTTKINPKTGKKTTFNKPVYDIPKADNQKLIDYFTGQEKRKTSLLEVIGQDLIVEQLQELRVDDDFMAKLDTVTDGKAAEIMEQLDSELDTRNLEDSSFDTVKASRVLDDTAIEKLEQIARDKSITDAARSMGIPSPTVTNENREKRTKETLDFIKKGKVGSVVLEFSRLGNFAREYKKINGVNNYLLKDGTYVTENTTAYNNAVKDGTFKPKGGSLYYGVSDPAYKTALKAAKENDSSPLNKRLIELRGDRKNSKIKRVIVPKGTIIDENFIKDSEKQNETNMEALDLYMKALNDSVHKEGGSLGTAALFIASSYQATTGIIKIAAPFKYVSKVMAFGEGKNSQRNDADNIYREEHNPPSSVIGASLLSSIADSKYDKKQGSYKLNLVTPVMKSVKDNYYQTQLSKSDDTLLDNADLSSTLPEGTSVLDNPITRFTKAGINLNGLINPLTGKSAAQENNVGNLKINASKVNPNIIFAQNSLINEQQSNDIDAKTAQARVLAYEPIAALEIKASKINEGLFGDKINLNQTSKEQIDVLSDYDKAAALARDLDAPAKGISVFDFDDTLARTKEKVLYTKPNGEQASLTAKEFAEQATQLEKEGVVFDFSEFDNVINAKKGPLADLALKRQEKFGSKDIFVLTARPQQSATGIKMFLDGIGLNLPISNITGLENGTPGAKANWVASKAAKGYNDFYFADDAYKNVKAVQDVLNQIDVKSDVQLAKASKIPVFDKVFNDIIEANTGVKSEAEYSKARAQTVGAKKGKFKFFTTASAEDFKGLIYKLIGKGKVGDAQLQFFQDNVINPFNKAEDAVTRAKIAAANDYKALKVNLKTLPKSLSKMTGIGNFTFGQAARVAIWTRQGMEVPGMSKRDIKELNDFVDNNPEMNTFADELMKIQKGKDYPKPGNDWLSGTITSDIINEINKVGRAEYLQEWQQNVDIIFSEKNLNKLEALYGPRYVEAIRDTLRRMKSGSNRPIGGSRIVNNMLDWLNNSVGAIMSLNTRSAVLQTISAVNFIDWGDNNILKAAKAFANQKQFWGDFMTLINSPYLTERRDGLKINVSESEIADAVAESPNKVKAALNYILNKGFIMTRFADSFAIASGGATFYRNRMDALVKQGMDPKAASIQAFDDFRAIAEENQQSSNPSKISQQQASAAGRVILAFANTPMQYNRIIKRATQDLVNKRGDWKSNVSKIVYYAAVQNIIFNALQQALFAGMFEDEDEDDKPKRNKTTAIANGMIDSLVRGLGIQGSATVALKDALVTIYTEANKEKGSPKFDKAIYDLFGFSPPLDSKVRKLKSAANTFSWNQKEMKEEGFNLNNPAYLSGAQIISATTNVPLDRLVKKINNLRNIFSTNSQNWQKVAMAMGWSSWDVGLPYYGVKDKENETPQTILRDKVNVMKKETSTKDQKQLLLDLGLTKQEIKALKYEDIRVKKIIELQEKNKK